VASLAGLEFDVVDTAGLEHDDGGDVAGVGVAPGRVQHRGVDEAGTLESGSALMAASLRARTEEEAGAAAWGSALDGAGFATPGAAGGAAARGQGGGTVPAAGVTVARRMAEQTEAAVRSADAVWVLLDARAGVTADDEHLAEWLRRCLGRAACGEGGRVLVVYNKTDGVADAAGSDEWWSLAQSDAARLGLGGGACAGVSAAQGQGLAELISHLTDAVGAAADREAGGRAPVAAASAPGVEEAGRGGGTDPDGAAARGALVLEAALEQWGGGGLAAGEAAEDAGEAAAEPSAAAARSERLARRRHELATVGEVAVAVVGRPNVGKSTLVNRLVGSERLLTGPTAGLTRDATEVRWTHGGRDIALIDTAGMRRAGRWDWSQSGAGLEAASVAAARAALGRAGVVVLVVDAEQGLTKQDAAIASVITREGRPVVVAVNKVDGVPDRAAMLGDVALQVDRAVGEARGAAVVAMSALAGVGVDALMPEVMAAHDRWSRRVDTAMLNAWLRRVMATHPPPAGSKVRSARSHEHKGRPTTRLAPLRLRYLTQVNARPPTFVLFANRASLPASYAKFLVAALREEFDLWGVPLRLRVRGRGGDAPPRKR